MNTPSSPLSSPTQAPDTEPVNLNPEAGGTGYPNSGTLPPGTTRYRGRKARNRLIRLSSMPSWMYRAVVDKFMLGASPKSVASFIFGYPESERGGLQGLAFDTLRKYLQVLAEDVAEYKRLQPPPTMGAVQAEVRATIPAELQQAVAICYFQTRSRARRKCFRKPYASGSATGAKQEANGCLGGPTSHLGEGTERFRLAICHRSSLLFYLPFSRPNYPALTSIRRKPGSRGCNSAC